MTFLHPFGLLYLKLFGWRLENKVPDVQKCVIIAAPHSSNWDLPTTMATGAGLDLSFHFLAKHTIFRPPWGTFFRFMGGIPIDRRSKQNYVEKVAEIIRSKQRCAIVVAPEGTRSKTEFWKSGFYHIAKAADVPIVLGFLDYENKTAGIGRSIYPIGTPSEVMDQMRDFYRPAMARDPELFVVPRLKSESEPDSESESGRDEVAAE